MPNQLTDEQIDALLQADEASNGGNVLAIFARIHERRRKRAHAAAKAAQPELGIRGAPQNQDPLLLEKLRAFWRAPIAAADAESGPGALDYLLQTIQDTVDAGDVEDMLFSALRVCRKVWAWNMHHLGPIEGLPKEAEKKE